MKFEEITNKKIVFELYKKTISGNAGRDLLNKHQGTCKTFKEAIDKIMGYYGTVWDHATPMDVKVIKFKEKDGVLKFKIYCGGSTHTTENWLIKSKFV